MLFGRGGGGGVINRVSKEAGFTPLREITLQGGSFGNKRVTGDFDQPFGNKIALRMNGVYENSGSFRDHVDLERYGVNPTATFIVGPKTAVKLSYEYFQRLSHRRSRNSVVSRATGRCSHRNFLWQSDKCLGGGRR